ncbi:MAG: stage II sporulation protein R [Oscillospiraceae bacterium]|nr:stage II sporulation protein R [Oscillospiraceae bacterium]
MELNGNRKLHAWELALMLSLCLALLTGLWAQGTQARLAGRLVRLHVIAASDSAGDQAEKLAVRDAVLRCLAPKLAGAENAAEARRIVEKAGPLILRAARTATKQPVRVDFGPEHYPTRDYGAFALPAGEYDSLRITLGAGEGKNWWCVIFPPLCTAGAISDETAETLSQQDRALITRADGEYEIRFRILEIWDMVKEKLEK